MKEAQGITTQRKNPYRPVTTNTQRIAMLDKMNKTLVSQYDEVMSQAIIPESTGQTGHTVDENHKPNANSISNQKGVFSSTLDPAISEDIGSNFESTAQMHQSNQDLKDFDKKIMNFKIENYGANLSLREKQLIYLAKALVNKPKIQLIDSQNCDLDMDTWNIIQDTLKSDFQDSTIIQVMTKQENLQECDKVIQMDNGEIIEDGDPNNLLVDEESLLYKIVNEFNDLDSMNVGKKNKGIEDKLNTIGDTKMIEEMPEKEEEEIV